MPNLVGFRPPEIRGDGHAGEGFALERPQLFRLMVQRFGDNSKILDAAMSAAVESVQMDNPSPDRHRDCFGAIMHRQLG